MSEAAPERGASGDAPESPPGSPRPASRWFEFDVLDGLDDDGPVGAGGEETAAASAAQEDDEADERRESASAAPAEEQGEGEEGTANNRLFDFEDLEDQIDDAGSVAAQSAGRPEEAAVEAAGAEEAVLPADPAPQSEAGAAAAAERREEPLSSFAAFHEGRGSAGQAAANELADAGALGTAGLDGPGGGGGGPPKPLGLDQQKLPGRAAALELPSGTLPPDMGDKECCEPLVLITESSGWDPGNQDLHFRRAWADDFGSVCHQLRLRLAPPEGAPQGASSPQPDGEPTYVSCAFQILSVSRGWDWRIYPSRVPAKGKAWGRENLLIPSDSGAVEASHGSEHGHGRYFCIVEPSGSTISVSVILSKEYGELQPCIWYECCDAAPESAAPGFCGCDRTPVSSSQARAALKLRGQGPPKHPAEPTGSPAKTNGSAGSSPKAAGPNAADPSRWPCGAEKPYDGLTEVRENLVLVCDATDWLPTDERARFAQLWSTQDGAVVRHQLCVKLAGEGGGGHSGLPLPWENAFVSLTFQVLSRDKKWEWRLFPAEVPLRGDGKAWGPENVLVPGAPDAVKVMQGAEGKGLSLHGRDFHIVEPWGTVVTICVELSVNPSDDAPRQVRGRVWYEHFSASLRLTCQDKKPVAKGGVLKAMKYRGLDPAHEWERAIKARCPMWWRRWDKQEQAARQLSQRARKAFEAERAGKPPVEEQPAEAQDDGLWQETKSSKQRVDKKKKKPFTKEEALYHIGSLASHLTTNQKTLEECRTLSSVKFGLFETFPYMPPKAIAVLSQMVEEALKKSSSENLHAFLDRFNAAAWDSGVQKAFEKLTRTIEAGDESAGAKRDKEAIVAMKDKSTLAACGTRLSAGTKVMLRWQPNSEGARYLAYLNGHVGVLVSFDRSTLRWTVGFETFDGHLQVASEHLHVVNETVSATGDKKAASRKGAEQPECDMCNGRFLESQLLVLGCPHAHQYCHECLRKWVRLQLVPRCYRCLEDSDSLLLPENCSGMPWMAVPKSDGAAADDYRISKTEIDQLDCICAVEVSGGAQCIILGVQGLCGKRCTVGRVEKSRAGCFAAVYLAGGRKLELCTSCLEVDDCLSSGRLAKGEPCPSKGERFGLGLSVASLGCACPVKQTMNELYVEQFAMPYDWLVSRVEGVMYFFRHGFRDFVHYDDVRKDDTYHGFFHEKNAQNVTGGMEKDGDHGYCSYRTVYHSFPHHDVSEANTRGAFVRRCDRLLHLVKGAILEATSRPILLARICARTQELDFSEELYSTLRALGGQKIYLLIILTEQKRNVQGAVAHIRHPNLIFYIAGTGGGDLADGLRFGMDYAYLMDNFGLSDVTIARRVSPLSPIGSAAVMRREMSHHQIWLDRDKRGEPSLTDIGGCFEAGPNQYYPGRYHKGGTFEASPHLSKQLQEAARTGDVKGVAKLARDGVDINAWDAKGETVLFPAAARGDLATCAALILAAADPNCRDRKGQRAVEHVRLAEAQLKEEAKEKEAAKAKAEAKAKARAAAQKGKEPEKKAEAARTGNEIVPFASALSLMGAKQSEGPDVREQLRHIRTLLLHAGGLDTVREQDVLAAVAAVPEPDRRRLVSRLGICTPPDLLPTKVPVLKLAKSTQVLFTRHMLSEAEAKGEDMVSALMKLRDSAGMPLPERRQILRVMLRDWHPDKHQGKPKEEQDHANAVFCYIQGMRTLFLGPEDKEAAGGPGKER